MNYLEFIDHIAELKERKNLNVKICGLYGVDENKNHVTLRLVQSTGEPSISGELLNEITQPLPDIEEADDIKLYATNEDWAVTNEKFTALCMSFELPRPGHRKVFKDTEQ